MNNIENKDKLYIPEFIEKDNDFIDFKFGEYNGSDFNLYRVSGNNRYDEGILPVMEDKTAQVPGNDGVYYFGSYYTQKPIQIDFAFDSLTEKGFRQMRTWLGSKKVQELIFYEEPYKIYMAKITNPPTLSYICFEEMDNNGNIKRIYKGEGVANFICYEPFAICKNKILESYSEYTTLGQWKETSGLLTQKEYEDGNYDKILPVQGNSQIIKVYNPGDFDTDFILRFPVPPQLSREELLNNSSSFTNEEINQINDDYILEILIEVNDDDKTKPSNIILDIPLLVEYDKDKLQANNTTHIQYNSKMHLIEGINNTLITEDKRNGMVYNNFILSTNRNGDFFKIPMNSRIDKNNIISVTTTLKTQIPSSELFSDIDIDPKDYISDKIEYNYLYY